MAAAQALVAVDEGAHLDEALAHWAPPAGPDRDLAWFLAYGTVRRRGHVDGALRSRVSRPLGGLDAGVRAVLRVGAFEKLFARTEPYAVVHQAVEVVRALGLGRASGMVNAVLRRVAPASDLRPDEAADHPAWLLARWTDRYGEAATLAWCRANGEPPPLFVVTRGEPPGIDAAVPASLGGQQVPGVWQVAASGPVPSLPGFAEGHWWVQDLAAVAMADLVQARPGMRVLDACAAPGGKAFRLASQGAQVRAVDRDVARLDRIQESRGRLGFDVPLQVHDWREGPLDEQYDAVLVDAPCTALGTIRRHPEIRWRRQPSDIAEMANHQRTILEAAAASVAPGGALVYAVCSPEPEEGRDVVANFLARHADFEQEEERATAPPENGEDAHFGVRMRRHG